MANPYKAQAASAAKDKKSQMIKPDKLGNSTDFGAWAKYAEKGGKTGKAGYSNEGADGHLAKEIKMQHAASNGYGRKELGRKTKP